MTMTIEPGYYEEGAFGIRHENEAIVVLSQTATNKEFLTFEPVTYIPFQVRNIILGKITL